MIDSRIFLVEFIFIININNIIKKKKLMDKTSSNRISDEERHKNILLQMNNSDIPLDIFFERMEKQYGNRLFFSQLKNGFEDFYPTISKSKIK